MTEREVKPNLNRLVVHRKSGIRYRLVGAIIHRDKKTGGYWYQAQLSDLRAQSSEVICRLEDIELAKDRDGE